MHECQLQTSNGACNCEPAGVSRNVCARATTHPAATAAQYVVSILLHQLYQSSVYVAVAAAAHSRREVEGVSSPDEEHHTHTEKEDVDTNHAVSE